MSDIYLSLTETPTVVTLSQPVVSGVLASTVTVANTVTVALDSNSLSALENVTVTVGAAVSISNFPATQVVSVSNLPATQVVSVSNLPATQTIAGTVTLGAGTSQIGSVTVGNTTGLFNAIIGGFNDIFGYDGTLKVDIRTPDGSVLDGEASVPVQGTVDIESLPTISGTVTAAAPNGALTTRFGTPTAASSVFATSAVTNANRKYLLIQNVTTQSNVITVGIGFTPTTTQGIQLTAGAGITFESSYIPTGQVFILSSVTASNFTILEA